MPESKPAPLPSPHPITGPTPDEVDPGTTDFWAYDIVSPVLGPVGLCVVVGADPQVPYNWPLNSFCLFYGAKVPADFLPVPPFNLVPRSLYSVLTFPAYAAMNGVNQTFPTRLFATTSSSFSSTRPANTQIWRIVFNGALAGFAAPVPATPATPGRIRFWSITGKPYLNKGSNGPGLLEFQAYDPSEDPLVYSEQ
jgi:hypothetical protein